MSNKKGLSDVVTTVLIVLLTLVAIAILWSFLQPMFTRSGTKIQQAEACLTASLEVSSCTVTSVTVKRNAGDVNITEIRFIFEKADGSTSVVANSTVPGELGTNLYSNILGLNAKSVSVAAGIADAQGNINYCNPTQPVACR